MKKPVFLRIFSLLITFALILSGIGSFSAAKAATNVPVTGITLSKQSVTIDVASSIKLTAQISPVNATNKEVIWQTDNPSVARVTNGLVRGYGEGTTVIRAISKDQGKVAYCIVVVKKSTEATPIINVRADDDNNGIPDFLIVPMPFVIEGRVSADFRVPVNNVLSGKIYIQDSTAGIAVNGITKELALGSKIKITGNVVYNDGETQFSSTKVVTVNTAIQEIKPAAMSTKDSMLETKEGLLVSINGKITKTSAGTIYVNDTTDPVNEARVIIGSFFTTNIVPIPSTTSASSPKPTVLEVGDTVNVTGIAAQDGTGHKIVIRNAEDISLVTSEDEDQDTKDESLVSLNKSSIAIKAGKFEHINILTKPGNAVVTSLKIKTSSPIITISQDKKNSRLITVTPNKDISTTSQKIEIEVVVNGKSYILTLDVKVIDAKVKSNGKGNLK